MDLINRQDWYTQGIERATTFEISSLDNKVMDLLESLRMMIMRITTIDGNSIFTSVDTLWDDGVVFTFPRMYEEQAKNRIADLASYFRHHFGNLVLCKYFTPDAAQRAITTPWNEQEGRAVSSLDNNFYETLKDCDGINWLTKPTAEKVVIFPSPQINTTAQPMFNHMPNDDKSLETFGSYAQSKASSCSGQKRTLEPTNGPFDNQKRSKQKNESPDVQIIENEELTDDDDAQTIDTLSSRMSTLETNMSQILGLLKQSIGSNMPRRPNYYNASVITPNSKERGDGS